MVIDQATPVQPLPVGPIELPEGDSEQASIWRLLESVCDPEIPVLSLREIGVLRAVTFDVTRWRLWITPTYSGCPAVSQMKEDVCRAMQQAGKPVDVMTSLSPAWSSDWITETGKAKLRAYGIAPPHTRTRPFHGQTIRWFDRKHLAQVSCPQCDSRDTVEISHFGSTACKALYKCLSCAEPFDYFKPY